MKFMMTALLATFSSAALADFALLDLKKAADLALAKFQEEYPDHVAHLSGYSVAKVGQDAEVSVKIGHHGSVQEFMYTCLKVADGIECQAQEQ
jgi:hypothetical protein